MRPRPAVLVAIACAGLLVAACGGGNGESKASETKESSSAPVVDAALVAEGKAIATSAGCSACHSTNGSAGVGPSWKGIYGHSVTLADGSSVTADDAFLKESILTPNAKIAKGFSPDVMPAAVGQTLKDHDFQALIEYIKSLG